jgi:hypothetical protein
VYVSKDKGFYQCIIIINTNVYIVVF